MKNFLAIAAVSLTLPIAAAAQGELRTVTCSVADIQNAVGVCSQVEMPQPPADVTVQVRLVETTVTNIGLGGLTPQAAGLIFLGAAGIAAAASGGSSNGTNGTN